MGANNAATTFDRLASDFPSSQNFVLRDVDCKSWKMIYLFLLFFQLYIEYLGYPTLNNILLLFWGCPTLELGFGVYNNCRLFNKFKGSRKFLSPYSGL